jgi:predicted ester cyclase
MSLEENKALVRRLVEEVWDTGDYERLDSLSTPSFAESTQQVNQGMRLAFPDYRHTIEDLVAADDKVVLRWTARGTHQGELVTEVMRVPPTGKQMTITGIHIFRIADGRIAERWVEADVLGVLQQLGAIANANEAAA